MTNPVRGRRLPELPEDERKKREGQHEDRDLRTRRRDADEGVVRTPGRLPQRNGVRLTRDLRVEQG